MNSFLFKLRKGFISLLFLLYPLLSHAGDTIVYYGTHAKRDGVNFYSKCTAAITDKGWFQMSVYDYPLFKDGQKTTVIATISGKLDKIITSEKVDGNDVIAVQFYVDGSTSTDDIMIMTLNPNGMVLKFDYCVYTPDKHVSSKLSMTVDRELN